MLHAVLNVWIQNNIHHLSLIGGLFEGNFMNLHIITIESLVIVNTIANVPL